MAAAIHSAALAVSGAGIALAGHAFLPRAGALVSPGL
jgi:hypothetical protein